MLCYLSLGEHHNFPLTLSCIAACHSCLLLRTSGWCCACRKKRSVWTSVKLARLYSMLVLPGTVRAVLDWRASAAMSLPAVRVLVLLPSIAENLFCCCCHALVDHLGYRLPVSCFLTIRTLPLSWVNPGWHCTSPGWAHCAPICRSIRLCLYCRFVPARVIHCIACCFPGHHKMMIATGYPSDADGQRRAERYE